MIVLYWLAFVVWQLLWYVWMPLAWLHDWSLLLWRVGYICMHGSHCPWLVFVYNWSYRLLQGVISRYRLSATPDKGVPKLKRKQVRPTASARFKPLSYPIKL